MTTGNTPRRRRPRRRSRAELAWPWVLRLTGLGMLVYETAFDQIDRPSLLMAALALVFLDRFVMLDRRRNGSE